MYVPEIIFLRPTESKSGPRVSGPSRFPTENARPYHGTLVALDVVELGEDQGIGEEDGVVQERLGDHQRGAEDRPLRVGAEHEPRGTAR